MQFLVLLILFFTNWAFAAEPVLRWGADAGAPFTFQDPSAPTQYIGFEVDIVNALARELGMKPVYVQNTFDGLIQGLNRNDYDIAVNGLEITEDRKAQVLFSEAYYATPLQIVVRADENTIYNFSDLVGKKVGTIGGAVSERMLRAEPEIEVLIYDQEFSAHQDLENGRIDAVFFDSTITKYFSETNPRLRLAGEPISALYYGIAMRKTDRDLQKKMNAALLKMRKSGELREILDRWNLWNPLMVTLTGDHSPSNTPPSEWVRFLENSGKIKGFSAHLARYKKYIPVLLEAAVNTLKISMLAMIVAIVVGLFLATARLYGPKPVQILVMGYIELIRGTPLLLQLFFIFYALPLFGIKFPAMLAAVLGLGLNYAANEAENYRAGISAVGKAQTEAALALGMNQWQSLFHIILPQGIRIVIPPVTNDFIALLKDSSLVSAITLMELTKAYNLLSTTYYDYIGTGILTAMIYLLMGLPFVKLARHFEKKFAAYKIKHHVESKNQRRLMGLLARK